MTVRDFVVPASTSVNRTSVPSSRDGPSSRDESIRVGKNGYVLLTLSIPLPQPHHRAHIHTRCKKVSAKCWAVHEVDGIEFRRVTYIFRLSNLVKRLSLDVPERASQHIQGTFICLYRIPASAIMESRTPAEIEYGKYTDNRSQG